jgi:release factor glutamine methyltransferase
VSWRQLLREITEQLMAAGVPSPRPDAEQLAAHASGAPRSRVRLWAAVSDPVSDEVVAAVRALAERRARRIPLQYLTGVAPFLSLTLEVGPGVLIPRPETELLAQAAIRAAERFEHPHVVDVGTGSGAIALAVATALPQARVTALEPDAIAYTWAAHNLRRFPDAHVTLHRAAAADLPALAGAGADVVVSNPPYLPDEETPLDPEVRDFDPTGALFGGPDGLDVIREVISAGSAVLTPLGVLLCEHTEDQGERVRALCAEAGLSSALTHPDLTGRDRFTAASHVPVDTMTATRSEVPA